MHRIPEFFQARFSEQRLVAGVERLQYRDAASQVLPTAMLACGQGCLVVGRLTIKGAARHSNKLQHSDRASNCEQREPAAGRAQQQRQVAAQDKVQQSLQQT